jgi:vacuolar-type H+-ATPase subunit E/Vma4
MGLDELVKQIKDETDAKVAELLDKAKKQSQEESIKAEEHAVKIMQHYKQKGKLDAEQILAREHSISIIESKLILQRAIDDKISESYMFLNNNMDRFIKSKRYAALLDKLVLMAKLELGDKCVIEARKEDIKLIVNAKAKANNDIRSGIMAYSEDGKRYINYSLDALIAGMKEQLSKRFSENIK